MPNNCSVPSCYIHLDGPKFRDHPFLLLCDKYAYLIIDGVPTMKNVSSNLKLPSSSSTMFELTLSDIDMSSTPDIS